MPAEKGRRGRIFGLLPRARIRHTLRHMGVSAKTAKHDPPDSARSVGYTEPKRALLATAAHPFPLRLGGELKKVEVEYETYGELNATRSNAILVCHALSGDAHAAGWDHSVTESKRGFRKQGPGWWDRMIGPGKAIDTRRFFVICSNVLGSCYGTTGPESIRPESIRPYGSAFPAVTVEDWVALQARLLDHLGIEKLHTVVGGSLGGQQTLEWALRFPERVQRAVILAAAARLSPQGMAFNYVGRNAITSDPAFQKGEYQDQPARGLAIARMLAHITYLAHEGLANKARRKKTDCAASDVPGPFPEEGDNLKHGIRSFLDYNAANFVGRFDANSYLRISHAMDDYDAARVWGGGNLVEACRRLRSRLMIVSFSSDWLYTPEQCRELALAVSRAGHTMTYVNVMSENGHDAFLTDTEVVGHLIGSFLSTEVIA